MTENLNIVAIGHDRSITEGIEEHLGRDKNIRLIWKESLEDGGPEGLAQQQPDILLVDLDPIDKAEEMLQKVQHFKADHPEVGVLVCSRQQSPQLLMAVMRAGIREFLSIPVRKDEITQALSRIRKFQSSFAGRVSTKSPAGKAFSFFGPKGGVGVTTLTVNVGAAISLITGKNTAVFDLDLQVGDVVSFLDLAPRYNILDVCRDQHEVDVPSLQSCMTYHQSGVMVLAEPANPFDAAGISARQIQQITQNMKKIYPYTVIDTPHTIDPGSLEAFNLSDIIFLVIVANVSSIRAAKKSLAGLAQAGVGDNRIRVIVNRASRKDHISAEDIEEALRCRVYWTIPNNYAAAVEAINNGVPLVKEHRMSNIGKSIYKMAESILDETAR